MLILLLPHLCLKCIVDNENNHLIWAVCSYVVNPGRSQGVFFKLLLAHPKFLAQKNSW